MLATSTLTTFAEQVFELKGDAEGRRFDGIGVVNGGGATSVLLKDYPEPQRSQILDLVYKPHFGASVSALLVEIPGDGNSTQGSMPSHMHTREDLNYSRGYTWWILQEAKKRNPNLTLDGTAWSAPGWVGKGKFWSQDAADYYVKWLQGLRAEHGLELDAIGCRNEKGYSLEFAKMLRKSLNEGGFQNVKLHAFDHWPEHKFDFVKDLLEDKEARDSIDIIGAHVLNTKQPKGVAASKEVQAMAAQMNKPIWNTEEHVYKKGFDCAISIVQSFNDNYIRSRATKIVNWYDIAGVYPMEPYSEDPAMILARSPWSGHYQIREALWGYAHYGQFTQVGWQYLDEGCKDLADGGTMVTLKSPANDYSLIIETKDAKGPQQLRFQIGRGLSHNDLCVWHSNEQEQFVRKPDISSANGTFTLTLEPNSIYSLSTTRGQQKGSFKNIPVDKPFPFPYSEAFDEYTDSKAYGYLPHYTADIAGAFELTERPDDAGQCLRQVVPTPTISWAPDWRPYTILGDQGWSDYEVSADIYLNPDDTAGVMGRINHVGTGYGFIPKGYFLQLDDQGQCQLVVVRGKKDKKQLVGDAEQQALIKAGKDEGEGGEKVLGTIQLPGIAAHQWHNLKLRFDGSTITALVDGKEALKASDNLYSQGMAGLLAGQEEKKVNTPYFDNVLIKGLGASLPKPSSGLPNQLPIYNSNVALPVTIFKNLQAGKPQTVIVYGTSLSHTAAWPTGLKGYFDKLFPGQVTFLNRASSGKQSNWGVANFNKLVLSANPDLVFIEFSMNDAATKHSISTGKALENLDYMVKALRQQNPRVDIVLQTMNTVWDAPDEPEGKKSASDRPHLTDYYNGYRQYAREHSLPLIDHCLVWHKLQQQEEAKFRRWLPDGTHPSPEASLAVTLPGIETLVEKAREAAIAAAG